MTDPTCSCKGTPNQCDCKAVDDYQTKLFAAFVTAFETDLAHFENDDFGGMPIDRGSYKAGFYAAIKWAKENLK